MKDRDSLLTPRARDLRTNATKQENHLWYDYLHSYPVRFFRQFIIGEYITDFCCRNAKVVVELDGQHHREQDQIEYDAERDAYLRGRGYEVLRFSNHEVDTQFREVCDAIDRVIRERPINLQ